MKNIFRFGMVAAVLASFTFVFTSCSKDDGEDEAKLDDRLVGTKWACEDPVHKMIYGGTCYQFYEFTSTTKVEKYTTKNGVVDDVDGELDYTLNYPDITINTIDSDGKIKPYNYRFTDSRTMVMVKVDGTLATSGYYSKYYKQ
ncbi:MAG: hypothetical protein IKZ99_06600 [Salinivirgaceae bacterium]|nr:hypothetical protein [Salinivirgaceae bacterium]